VGVRTAPKDLEVHTFVLSFFFPKHTEHNELCAVGIKCRSGYVVKE